MIEYIKANAEDDWECLCGNHAMSDGFYPSDIEGNELEPLIGGPWDGRLVMCARCGRIIDQTTFEPPRGGRVRVVRAEGPVKVLA
jgi:hypothetical protein